VGRALISARSAESFSFVTPARNRRAVYRRFIKDNWNRERVFASFGVPTFDVKYPFPSPPLFLPPITGANYKRSRTRLMPSPEFCDVRGVSAARMFSETGNTGIFPLPLPLPPPLLPRPGIFIRRGDFTRSSVYIKSPLPIGRWRQRHESETNRANSSMKRIEPRFIFP